MGAIGRKPFVAALIVLATGALLYFLIRSSAPDSSNRTGAASGADAATAATTETAAAAAADRGAGVNPERHPKNDIAENKPPALTAATASAEHTPVAKKPKADPIMLTAANFERFRFALFSGRGVPLS